MKKTALALIVLVLCIPVIAFAQQTGGLPALRAALEALQTNLQNQINALQNQINSIPTGPQGPQGPAGPAGPAGPQGPAGANVAAGQQCGQNGFVIGFDQNGNIICSLFAIGDTGPAGGIVFYITDGGLHGLEAAPKDQSAAAWGCYGTATGAVGTGVGHGAQNTVLILADCTESGIAARIADDYTLNGYDDWFLPSKDELNLLCQQKDVVGGFTVNAYWSSSETNSADAWHQAFSNCSQGGGYKGSAFNVRAVRAF
jgi:hypothetical protein